MDKDTIEALKAFTLVVIERQEKLEKRREYVQFAAAALQGLWSNSYFNSATYEQLAHHAWDSAKAMIEQEPK